jgi:uncharacterized protein involved in cysteine biosynthesis
MKKTLVEWTGLNFIVDAFKLLKQHKELWKVCIVPVLLSMVAFSFGVYYFGDFYDWIREFIPTFENSEAYEADKDGFFASLLKISWLYILKVLSWIADLLVFIITLMLMYQISLTVIAIIASPFNDSLSAKVEEIINPTGKPAEDPSIISSIRIAAVTEAQRLSLFLGIFIPLYLFSFLVPGIGQVMLSIFTPVYTSLWLSYDSQVFAMDRRDWKMKQRLTFLAGSPVKNLTLGFWMMIMMIIPIVHFLVFPIFVTAGTLAFIDGQSKSLTQSDV